MRDSCRAGRLKTGDCQLAVVGSGALRILGLDPGSRACGYGVIDDDGEPRYVECGVLVASITRAGAMEARLGEKSRAGCAR